MTQQQEPEKWNQKTQIRKCHKTAKDHVGHMKTNENLLWVSRKLTFTPWQSVSDKQVNNIGTARISCTEIQNTDTIFAEADKVYLS